MISIISPIIASSVTKNNKTYGIDKEYKSETLKPTKTKLKYTVTPKTGSTKNILKYMKKFEKKGGGTLIFKKGYYKISKTISIPSNVNIVLRNGAVLKKTGNSTIMFQLVAPSKANKKNVYGKYNGVKNVKFIGKGSATINLNYRKYNHAIYIVHSKNIQIQGIRFMKSNTGHFIELDATKGFKISKCKFVRSKASKNYVSEAINLDTPDKKTKGCNVKWAKKDKYPNRNVLIANNCFKYLDRAIGTHQYSVQNGKQVYHVNVVVRNNRFYNMRSCPIRIKNWKNSKISNNYIKKVQKRNFCLYPKKFWSGILAEGVVDLNINNNYLIDVYKAVRIDNAKNVDSAASYYPISYSKMSITNIKQLTSNLLK